MIGVLHVMVPQPYGFFPLLYKNIYGNGNLTILHRVFFQVDESTAAIQGRGGPPVLKGGGEGVV